MAPETHRSEIRRLNKEEYDKYVSDCELEVKTLHALVRKEALGILRLQQQILAELGLPRMSITSDPALVAKQREIVQALQLAHVSEHLFARLLLHRTNHRVCLWFVAGRGQERTSADHGASCSSCCCCYEDRSTSAGTSCRAEAHTSANDEDGDSCSSSRWRRGGTEQWTHDRSTPNDAASHRATSPRSDGWYVCSQLFSQQTQARQRL